MRTDLFDFDLPSHRIALTPAEPRETARLLVQRADGALEDRTVGTLPEVLRAGDVLVVNDTKVIAASLSGVRCARGEDGRDVAVEANLIARRDDATWQALARPGKRLRVGDTIAFGAGALVAAVTAKAEDGAITLRFEQAGAALDAAIERVGAMPLPPYVLAQRPRRETDASDYQTVFASRPGAVAAPTAALHFTPALLARLEEAGVEIARLTLHVGAGTFLPVKSEDTADHTMHAEWREVSEEAADAVNRARGQGRRVVAIGTTALRALESAVDEHGRVRSSIGETDIFLTPGSPIRTADGLWTNFHLPRSTLFMLVAAFVGLDRAHAAYQHAIAGDYRFYSFGDACLFWKN